MSLQAQVDIVALVGLVTAHYAWTDHLSASAAYKVPDVDHDRSGRVHSTRLSRPVLGIAYGP